MVMGVIVFYSEKQEEMVRLKRISTEAPVKLKTVCCEKYKKGKRCKRCPCFDLIG